jgi:hypothetical protein
MYLIKHPGLNTHGGTDPRILKLGAGRSLICDVGANNDAPSTAIAQKTAGL